MTPNGRVSAASGSAVPDDYEIWSVEGAPLAIHLRRSIARQFKSVADKQSSFEFGGLLWGRTRDIGNDCFQVSIERAEHFSCDRSRGEVWSPSERDRQELRNRMRMVTGDVKPVGFWRTHLRPGLFLDKRDMDLMEGLFPEPWSVVLCVRPPSRAGFFVWEQGEVCRFSSYREFQLPDAGLPASNPLPAGSSSSPPPPHATQPWLGRSAWKSWAAGIAAAALVSAMPYILVSRNDAGSTPFNMLSMIAEKRVGVVRLNWDPNSRLVRNAAGATLWISDGLDEKKLDLTPEQLRGGSIEYRPLNPDLNFRMEVSNFTESLRIGDAIPVQQVLHLPPPVVEQTTQAEVTQEQVRSNRSRRKPGKEVRRLEVPVYVRPRPEPASIAEVPPAPQVHLASANLEGPPLAPPPFEMPNVVASVENPRSSGLKRAFGWMAGRKNFVPARPVKRVQPRLTVEETVEVAVRVSIDKEGIVQDADLVSKGVEGHVGRSAVEAAKRWIFEPAIAGGRPVSSSLVLSFQFEAGQRAANRPQSASPVSSEPARDFAGSLTQVQTDRLAQ